MPITWKNVQNSTGFVAGARLMDSASRSFNQGFGNFNKLLADSEQIVEDNTQAKIENTDAAFKDYLAGFKTPEALAAAEASGQIEAKKQELGGFLSKDLARTGYETQLQEDRADANAERTYNDGVALAVAKPLREQYLALKLDNQDEKAADFLTENRAAFDAAGMTADLTREGNAQDQIERNQFEDTYRWNRQVAEDKRTDKLRNDMDAADQFTTASLLAREQADVDAGQASQQMAVDMGVPLDANGKPDWLQASPEQRTAWQQAVTDAGFANPENDTEWYQNSLQQFRKDNPNAGRDAIARLEENLNTELARKNNILPQQQRERTLAMDRLGSKYNIARNSLANGQSTDPAADARKVIDSVKGKEDSALNSFFSSRQANSEEVEIAVSDALQRGVMVPVYDDAGVLIDTKGPYPVTPAMVETALGLTRSDWTDFGEKNVETLLQEYVTGAGYEETYKNYTGYQQESTELQNSWNNPSVRNPNGFSQELYNFQANMPKPTPKPDPGQQTQQQPAPIPTVLQQPAPTSTRAAPGGSQALDTAFGVPARAAAQAVTNNVVDPVVNQINKIAARNEVYAEFDNGSLNVSGASTRALMTVLPELTGKKKEAAEKELKKRGAL